MSAVKLLFTGDVCFKNQKEVTEENARPILAELLPTFEAADLRIMNLETPLAPEGMGEPICKSGPNILSYPENLGFLKVAGCDLAVLANNHTKDYGEEALFNTFDLLDKAGIGRCGAGHDIEEAYKAWRVTKNGVSVSVIAVCENEFGIADMNLSGTAGFDLERLGTRIREEKQVSQFVVVVFHGGCEHNPVPSPLCIERYRTIIRFGADALIGGHTHCMQGMEIFEGKPIVYSLGNFLFKYSTVKEPSWYHGYMAELTLGDTVSVRPIPYRFDPDENVIHPITGERLRRILAYLDRLSAVIADREEVRRLYSGWCTMSGLSYIKGLAAKPEYFDPANNEPQIAGLKNLLSCEAHNELIRTTLNLAFFGQLNDARRIADEVRELQKIPE